MRDFVVLKFGSSVLRNASDLPTAVHEIYRWYREGDRVIAVVSALGADTDSLLREATDVHSAPESHALAELLATGERKAAALLGISLDRAGIPARVIDPREIRFTALGSVLDSEPIALSQGRIEELLAANPVVVVPGFFGHDAQGRLHLLGRGGSDLSAVFLAAAVRATRCRLIKDVDCVYNRDPAATADTPAHLLSVVGYETAIEHAGQLIQPKAMRFLERYKGTVEVAGLCHPYETQVGDFQSELRILKPCPPATVLLLGVGTVGYGVYLRLQALQHHFKVVGVLCREPGKRERAGLPADLLHGPESRIDRLAPDIVVDALPGRGPSLALLQYFLGAGAHVVTANKRLIAENGAQLHRMASTSRVELLSSAAVGGSAPMLEAVERSRREGSIEAITGILNGTCNYALDREAAGLTLAEALREAQRLGFAEAEPADDLSGASTERKLRILGRLAFPLKIDGIDVRPLNARYLDQARANRRPEQAIRYVADLRRRGGNLQGSVRLEVLDPGHPLASVREEWNALLITRDDGTTSFATGRGAGRWPTTEAVIAALLSIRFGQIDAACSVPNPDSQALSLN